MSTGCQARRAVTDCFRSVPAPLRPFKRGFCDGTLQYVDNKALNIEAEFAVLRVLLGQDTACAGRRLKS